MARVTLAWILLPFLVSCSQLKQLGSRLLSGDAAIVNALVTGLGGANLTVKLNDEAPLKINATGKVELSAALTKGAEYTLAIVSQPVFPNQVCSIDEPKGFVATVDFDISISCSPLPYEIGGTISGLAGSGLQLQLNAGEVIFPSGNGSFQFSGALNDGSTYNVQVLAQPAAPAQICTPTFNNAPVLGQDVTSVQVICDTILYPVGGFVSGLNGSGLELQINGGDDLAVNNNGFFVFNTPVADTASYVVTVKTNPAGPVQTCSVSNGSGVIAGGGSFDVSITCNTQAYSLTGSVTTLSGAGLALLSSTGEIVTVNNPGAFAFNQAVSDGSPYFVKVFRQPTSPSEHCTVVNDSGTIAAVDVTNLQVDCVTQSYGVGGTVADLSGSGLTLRLNGAEDLVISPGATSFTFNNTVSDGASYLVEVVNHPQSPLEHCSIATPSGTIASANVSNVPVDCDPAFSVGGTVTGLLGASLVLQNNGGDNLPISGNGAFTFASGLLPSSAYAVTVANHPENAYQVCTVGGGSGGGGSGSLPGASNYAGIIINCNTITAQFASGSTSQNESVTSFNIPVNLSATTPRDVIINYAVSGGTAVNSVDYTIGSGTLTIPQGSNSGNIVINVTDDAAFESDETVQLSLTGVFGATLSGTLTHTYTIQNNDAPPTVSFTVGAQSTGTESGAFIITAQLSATAGNNVTVPFTVNGSSTATGGGTDYSITSSPLVILAGQTTADITITIATDSLDEIDEDITIDMGAPTNANLGGITSHTLTINDDDSQPTVGFTSASQNSGGSEAGTMLVTAQLSAPSGQTVTVPFSIDGASTAIGSGTDYTVTASPITITAGSTTGSATITIQSESIDEDDETVVVNMGGPTNATASGIVSHTATINDDDNPPTVQFTAGSQNSGTETGAMTITAQLSHLSSKTITVPFSVNGSSTATGGGTDYSISGSPLTFNPLDTSEDITITIATDSLDEDDETVIVDMGSPTNATASGTTTHTATIDDDDNAPLVDFTLATSNSGGTESGTITITAILNAASGKTITVPFSVNGSSTATGGGTDYSISASPLNFTPGDTSEDITITITTDTDFEGDETVIVDMGSPTNATASGTTTHTATINDDDNPTNGPAITAADYFDLDEDGYLDHVRLTFDNNLDDSTFDGHLGTNNLGNVTTEFAIAGYSNVRIDTRDATVTDTDDDAILWLAFDEGSSYDTAAKPDLTATDASLRGTAAGNCYIMTTGGNCTTQADADIVTLDVVEADLAPPVLVEAIADNIIDAFILKVVFSETADSGNNAACPANTTLVTSANFTYNNVSGGNVTSLSSETTWPVDGSNTQRDLCDDGIVYARLNGRATLSDINTDTLQVASNVFYDVAGNGSVAKTATLRFDSALELYYPMSASVGDTDSVVNDVTTNGRNGVVSAPINRTTDMSGISNEAYLLDGSNSPIVASGYKGVLGTAARSVSIWAKADTSGNLIFWGELGGDAFLFMLNGLAAAGFEGALLQSVGNGGTVTCKNAGIGTGWHHYAVSIDAGANVTDVRLYVNGVLITDFSSSSGAVMNTVSQFDVIVANVLSGKVDEVRIYSRALTGTEIKKLATKVPSGLVVHHSLDNTGADLTGNGNDATLNGAPTSAQDRYGNSTSSYSFAGSDYLTNSAVNNMPTGVGVAVSYCAWFKRNVAGGNRILMRLGASQISEVFKNGSQGLTMQSSGAAANISSTNTTALNHWSHMCGVSDGTGVSLYLDGMLEATSTGSNSITPNSYSIGASAAGANPWSGDIDDVRIYNRALTSGEVKALATELDRGLVAYYPLDDNTTSTATGAIKDYSGKNPNLTLTAGPVPTADRFGNSVSAYLYNGTGKMESESTPTNLPVNDANRTVCAWAAVSASGSNYIMEYGGAAASNHIKYRIFFDNDLFESNFRTGGKITSPVAAAYNQWAHYCARFRNNNTNDIIVNGIIEGTVTGYTNAATGQDGFVIGSNLFSTRFNGSIDDVRVYDRALSLAEIRELSGFHPGQLDNITLHLDATRALFSDAGTTLITTGDTAVQQWRDISFTNGTANGVNLSQGTSGQRPLWRSSVAGFNNLPAVDFDGSDDYLTAGSILGSKIFNTNESTVFVILRQNAASGTDIIFTWGGNANRYLFSNTGSDNLQFTQGDISGGGEVLVSQPVGWDGTTHLVELTRLTSNVTYINVEGINLLTSSMTDPIDNSVSNTFNLSHTANRWDGDIAEIIIYKTGLAADHRNEITCYLSKKYNITVSTSCD